MKKIVLGGLAVLVGVVGMSLFFSSFLSIILGLLPVLLILGGALAFYLGFTDIQESKSLAAQEKNKTEPEPDDRKIPAADDIKETQAEEKSEPAPQPTESAPAPLYKGNAETLVFHSIDCKFSQGKKCTKAFATREEAVEKGYTPCKVCRP